MSKYKIDFIEEPSQFTSEEMNSIYGGYSSKGVCIGFTNCNCDTTDNKHSYSSKCNDEKEKKNKEEKEKKLFKKHNNTYCFIVTIK